MNSTKTSHLTAYGCAPTLFPTETFFGVVYCDYDKEEVIEIPQKYPFHNGWGTLDSIYLLDDDLHHVPQYIDMVWLSIVENVFYSIISPVNKEVIQSYCFADNDEQYNDILVGMAPYGGIAIWIYNDYKSILINWLKAEVVHVEMSDFLPSNPTMSLRDYCNSYINSDKQVKKNLEENGLPPRDLFDKYMQQFSYRYLVRFDKWDEENEKWIEYDKDEVQPEFEYMEEMLYDGTHDKLHDGGLMKFHEAGKPMKISVQWHIKKSDYSAYFWFEEKEICAVFDKFYGAHPDTKTDFIIHIDPVKKKYQLSLYRYGLKEPATIPEKAYQLIVFKSKFENYRSDNYNQKSGAWAW